MKKSKSTNNEIEEKELIIRKLQESQRKKKKTNENQWRSVDQVEKQKENGKRVKSMKKHEQEGGRIR